MQAHPLALFEEDVAAEVADLFQDALADGQTVRTATRQVIEELEDYLDDDEQRGLVWLALAVLQLEHGALQPSVRRHALAALANPEELWPAVESDDARATERQQMIAQLTTQLTTATPSLQRA